MVSWSCAKEEISQTDAMAAAPDETVLARVNDVIITVKDLQDQLNRQTPYVRKRYESLSSRRDFLDNMIRFEVLAKEAANRGFHKDPAVVRSMKQVMIKKLLKAKLGEQVKLESITEEEMQAYFNEHRDEFSTDAQVRVAAIVLKRKREAQSVLKLATEDGGKTNKAFRDLVDRYSVDEITKLRGGDLRYFNRATKEIPSGVVSASFSLSEIGEVAGPIQTKNGFYVIKLMGKRPALNRTFEQVRTKIQNRIYQNQRTAAQKAYVRRLKSSANVQVFEKNLQKIKLEKETKSR